jgi:DNA repair protein RecN (Recombination protein N)
MLAELRVRSFAIINELQARFGPGMTALTGETGAGKSILVDALHLVLGGRADPAVVRTGCDEAEVEALFHPRDAEAMDARLEALGLPAGRGELVVRRLVQREGKSRAWVNGALATARQLADATAGLLDISGQHEHVSLLDPEGHLGLLDAHAGLSGALAEYRAAFERLSQLSTEKAALQTSEAERARRLDYLKFCVEEIDRVAPREGEEESLQAERRVLAAAAKLREAAEAAEARLYSAEGAAVESAGAALRRVEEALAVDATLAPAAEMLRNAVAEMEEAARLLSRYAERLGGDGAARLEEIEERLEALHKLARKHGSVAEAVRLRAAMGDELRGLETHDERLAELEKELQRAAAEAAGLARKLGERRREAARAFARAVVERLSDLGMAATRFEARLSALAEGVDAGGLRLGPRGAERCDFLLSPNRGEELKELSRIASGGELSRVMLAVKGVLAERDPVETYVFDEVDAGIGGGTAEAVGRALQGVARAGRQVLVVTHLPQIAALADAHFTVDKVVVKGRTLSRLQQLAAEEERRHEIARMLSGELTSAALDHAREMLSRAEAPARKRARG